MLSIKWYDAIKKRKSRRNYLDRPIKKETLLYLEDFISKLNDSIDGARVKLVIEAVDDVFKGAIGSYGIIKGAKAYVAFIGNKSDINFQEKVGFIGESFILEATSLGLSTCWVAGFFRPEIVKKYIKLLNYEIVLAISPLGYTKSEYSFKENIMSGFSKEHKRKSLDSLYTGISKEEWPEWVVSGLEAARLAPSAINRQPWRFDIKKDSIKVSVNSKTNLIKVSKRLDCGISMLHISIGALNKNVKGKWTYLESPEVAVFKIN